MFIKLLYPPPHHTSHRKYTSGLEWCFFLRMTVSVRGARQPEPNQQGSSEIRYDTSILFMQMT